jgi:hypothetical protein
LALLIGSVFLDFFGCRLLLLVLLRSWNILLKRASELYLSTFTLLRNWFATGLEQVDGSALALCPQQIKSVNQRLVFAKKIFSSCQASLHETKGTALR